MEQGCRSSFSLLGIGARLGNALRCALSSCKNFTVKATHPSDQRLTLPPLFFQPSLRGGRRFPRRQEAEFAYVGSRTALVTHEEARRAAAFPGTGTHRSHRAPAVSRNPVTCLKVLAWANDQPTEIGRIVSVSAMWEAREHPDPYGYQLQKLATSEKLRGQDALYIAYVSLFQFKRLQPAHEESFRRARRNLHVLFAHEWTRTLRIESLTPEERVREAWCNQEHVQVYHVPSGCVRPVLAAELVQNRTPHHRRGWCVAELQWSSTRYTTGLSEEVDSVEGDVSGVAPMDPETFRATVGPNTLKFTHRSDEDVVLQLQKRVFEEKAARCRALQLSDLSADALAVGLSSLDHYPQLESLAMTAPCVCLLLSCPNQYTWNSIYFPYQ